MSVDFQVNVNVQPHGKEKIDELERQIERLKSETVRINFETEGTSKIEKAFKSMESQMQHQAVSAGKSFQKSFNKGMKSVGMDPVDYAKKQAKEQKEVEKIAKKMQDSVPEINYDFDEDVGKNAVKSAKKYLKEKEKAVEQSAKEQQKIAEQQAKAQQKAQEQNLKQTLKNQAAIDKIESRQSFAQYKQRAVDKNAHNNSLVNNAKQFYENKKAEIAEQQKIAEQQAKAQQKAQDKFNYNFDTGKYKADQSRMKSQLQSYSGQENEANIQKATGALKDYNDALNKLEQHRNGKNLSDSDYLKEMENLDKAASKFKNSMSEVRDTMSKTLAPGIAERGANKVAAYYEENSKAVKKYGAELRDLEQRYRSMTTQEEKTKYDNEFNNLKSKISAEGLTGKSRVQELSRAMKQIGEFAGIYALIQNVAMEVPSQMINAVRDVNAAQIELSKVSNAPQSQLNKYWDEASESAKKYGATISDVISNTADWSRLGYNLNDAKELSDATTLLQRVGDNMTQESSAQGMISTLKGFNLEAEEAFSIVDKVNEVANTQPIDTSGLFAGLERSASSMSAANNSLDQTIALITAANSVVQDPDSIGTAFKTISMRIRGASTEMEEAGLDTEGMAESTAKLREEILALSGVDIMKNENEFKSTYDILDELSMKWSDLSDIAQASVTELVAGKRQGNIMSALMSNFDIARETLNTATSESAGSAEKELSNYQKGIEYSLDKFKATFQDFSTSFLDSGFVKGVVDSGSGLLNGLTTLIDGVGVFQTLAGGIGAYKGISSFAKNFDSPENMGTVNFRYLHSESGTGQIKI